MAIAFDSSASVADSGGGGVISTNHTIGSASGNDRVLIACFASQGSADAKELDDFTFDSVSGTKLGEIDSSSDNLGIEMWYWLDSDLPSSTGTYTLSADFVDTSTNRVILCSALYTGGEQSAPQTAQTDTGGTTATSMSDSITTTDDDSWIVGFIAHLTNELHTPDTGQTEREDVNGGNIAGAIGDESIATAGAESMGWSWSTGDTYCHILTAINPGAVDVTLTQDSTATFTPVFNASQLDLTINQDSTASFTPVVPNSEIITAELVQDSTAVFTPVVNTSQLNQGLTQSSIASITPVFNAHAIQLALTQDSIITIEPVFYRSAVTGFTRITPNSGTFTQVTPNTEGFTKIR